MARKLSPELEREVLVKATQGLSGDAIAAWLKSEHGISISGRALRKRYVQTRTERAEVVKAAVRAELSQTVVSDLKLVDEEVDRLRALSKKTYARAMDGRRKDADAAIRTHLRVVDRIFKAADLKLHYSGADVPDSPLDEVAKAAERLDSRMDRLAAASGEGQGT